MTKTSLTHFKKLSFSNWAFCGTCNECKDWNMHQGCSLVVFLSVFNRIVLASLVQPSTKTYFLHRVYSGFLWTTLKVEDCTSVGHCILSILDLFLTLSLYWSPNNVGWLPYDKVRGHRIKKPVLMVVIWTGWGSMAGWSQLKICSSSAVRHI